MKSPKTDLLPRRHYYPQKPCDFNRLLEVLTEAYKVKVMKKMQIQEAQMNKSFEHFVGDSPLSILRKIKEMDND